MRTSIAVAAAVAAGLGCAVMTPTQAPPTTTTTSAADDVLAAPAPTGALAAEGPPPPPAARCRVSATNTEGCKPEQVEALVEPARGRMEKCSGPKGGKLTVRVRQTPTGKLAFDAEPDSSLDPLEQQCVLDTLNTIQIDPNSMAWMGPSVPPSGFTSLLTLEW